MLVAPSVGTMSPSRLLHHTSPTVPRRLQFQDMFQHLEHDLEVVDLTESVVDQQSNYAPSDATNEDTGQQQQEPSSHNETSNHRVPFLDAHLDELLPIATNIAAQRHQRLNPTYCQHLRNLGIADPQDAHPSVIQNHLVDITCEQALRPEDLALARWLLRDNSKDIMAVYVPAHACLEDYARTRDHLREVVPETNDDLLRRMTPKMEGISL